MLAIADHRFKERGLPVILEGKGDIEGPYYDAKFKYVHGGDPSYLSKINRWVDAQARYLRGLSMEEKAVLFRWIIEPDDVGDTPRMLAVIIRIFRYAPPVPVDVVVYKGISDPMKNVITYPRPFSTSFLRSITESFALEKILFSINIPSGSRGIYIDAFYPGGQAELLMPPNCRMSVHNRYTTGDMEVIQMDVTQCPIPPTRTNLMSDDAYMHEMLHMYLGEYGLRADDLSITHADYDGKDIGFASDGIKVILTHGNHVLIATYDGHYRPPDVAISDSMYKRYAPWSYKVRVYKVSIPDPRMINYNGPFNVTWISKDYPLIPSDIRMVL